jgi:hypothetical protein
MSETATTTTLLLTAKESVECVALLCGAHSLGGSRRVHLLLLSPPPLNGRLLWCDAEHPTSGESPPLLLGGCVRILHRASQADRKAYSLQPLHETAAHTWARVQTALHPQWNRPRIASRRWEAIQLQVGATMGAPTTPGGWQLHSARYSPTRRSCYVHLVERWDTRHLCFWVGMHWSGAHLLSNPGGRVESGQRLQISVVVEQPPTPLLGKMDARMVLYAHIALIANSTPGE